MQRPKLKLISIAVSHTAIAGWSGKCSTCSLGAASLSERLNSHLLFLTDK